MAEVPMYISNDQVSRLNQARGLTYGLASAAIIFTAGLLAIPQARIIGLLFLAVFPYGLYVIASAINAVLQPK